ncbi:hypothetical protein BU14_0205s0005 [Porphyra umbilicalis]|uniref:Uncharacterized protein n=1 Tax=Porphyra umbilicalis TaxID=2786 RepID=A0A1X6P5W1_PORUM|nr:hypothetical protein BU14_0205s0005 [Porphyra umbilicalis]|eukprot:OSX76130.1 hypothetical protein BU14_0205s0005 [Porphyra umbilicalis]
MIELFPTNNTDFNFHVHVSGYDTTGKIFWLQVFEDPNVVESASATQVLSMLYRYVESANGMMAASGSLLALKPASAATARDPLDLGHPLTTTDDELVAPAGGGAAGRGAAGGVASGGGARREGAGVGGRVSGTLGDGRGGRRHAATRVGTGSDGAAAGGTIRVAGGGPIGDFAARAATASQAESADLARAQAAAAAVLEADDDAGHAEDAAAGAEAVGATVASGVVLGGRGVVVGGCGVALGGGDLSGGDASLYAAGGAPRPAGPVDSGDDVDDDDSGDSGDSSSSSRSASEGASDATRRGVGKPKMKQVGGRPKKRQRWQRLAPVMHHAPASHIPTSDAKDLLRAMLDASTNRLTRLRCALVKGNAAVAGGMSARRLRICLPWWPRQAIKDAPWPLGVVVDKDLIVLACAKDSSTINTATVTAVLPKITLKRKATARQRLAEFLLLVEKSPAARAAMEKYISGFSQSARMQGKARAPVLGVLSGLRTAPRIAPSPAMLASLQAAPRRPGETFSSEPRRPAGFVPTGSPRPTHVARLAPEELPAPLPPTHPAAVRAAAAAAVGTVTPATPGKATSDSASIRAALLARAAGAAASKAAPSGTSASARAVSRLAPPGAAAAKAALSGTSASARAVPRLAPPGEAAAKATPSGESTSARAVARSAPPKSSTSTPAAPPMLVSSTSATKTGARPPPPARAAAPPAKTSAPPSAPPREPPARSVASGIAIRRPPTLGPPCAPESHGSSANAHPVCSRPRPPALAAAPPATRPSAPPSAPPCLHQGASAASATTAPRPAPPGPPAASPSPPRLPVPGPAENDGVANEFFSGPAGADSRRKMAPGHAPCALPVAAAAASGTCTSPSESPFSTTPCSPTGSPASTTPSRAPYSSAAPAPSGGSCAAELSPPVAVVRSNARTHLSDRPSQLPAKKKPATASSGSTGLATPLSVARMPLPPGGGTPRGETSLVTPAASSSRRPPLPPRHSPSSSGISRKADGKAVEHQTVRVAGGAAAVEKGGEAKANAANARKAND